MKKLIYILMGLVAVPIIFILILIGIPLLILFLLFLRLFAPRGRRMPPRRTKSRETACGSGEIYDIECEVVDEDGKTHLRK